eukprot:CAMPEP_0178567406 /NCGR_PEP_ID=MMETSP0697-20121206/15310_1 /TAXON_ID=265572 /ORGANISM="Extubocellulus spinifer, Strain CCMP396" /LENGTH=707 /DNA_ID=CAMNT_0020201341 /DNA_START=118 /DNA_END=2241 /DNA_ORIENTATION=-
MSADGNEATNASTTTSTSPPCQVLFRSKRAVTLHSVPPTDANPSGITLAEGMSTLHSFAPDGSSVLVHMPSVGVIRCDLKSPTDTSTTGGAKGRTAFLADSEGVQFLTHSTNGAYVVTWERAAKAAAEGKAQQPPPPNLKIWSAADGKFLHGFTLKNLRREAWPPIKWSHDGRFAFHMVTNEIHVYDGDCFAEDDASAVRYGSKIRCTGISSFDLPSKCSVECPTSPPPGKYLLSTFVPETKGKPARVALLRYPDMLGTENAGSGQAAASKSFYQAEECTVKWNPRGDSALVLTHTTVDSSGESYYGSTNLYLLLGDNGRGKGEGDVTNVPLPGSGNGPVVDVEWMPNESKPPSFVVVSGKMPAMSSLHHGTTAEPMFLFGNAHRNTIIWSQHGRFLALGGFGNLAGGIDFWDRNKLKKIPQYNPVTGADLGTTGNTASCAVGYGWSPSSRYFLVSTTTPRMNVDNGVRLYKYNGLEVTKDASLVSWDNASFSPDQLLASEFVPAAEVVYPDRPQTPPKKRKGGEDDSDESASIAATGAPAGAYVPPAGRYVPPAARRAGGGMSLAERMRKEREGSASGAVKVAKSGVPGSVAAGGKKKAPVGMSVEAESGGKSKNALRRERQRQAKERAAEAERLKAEEEAKKRAEEEATKSAAPVDPEKRAKKIKKLLKQIDELKKKDASSLNDDQKAKIVNEESLRIELEGLGI